MKLLDTNVILQWFLNDIPEQAAQADHTIRRSRHGTVHIDRITITEITYVLRSKGYDHHQIFNLLYQLYAYPSMAAPDQLDWQALQFFDQTKLDFEDCLLIAHHQLHKSTIVTFDKELLKHIT